MAVAMLSLCNRRIKQMMILLTFMTTALIVIHFIPDFNNKIEVLTDATEEPLAPVPVWLTRHSFCPACFGTDLCSDIQRNHVRLNLHALNMLKDGDNIDAKQLPGKKGNSKILLKTLVPDSLFKIFDEKICLNSSQSEDCDVSDVAARSSSFLVRQESFMPKMMQNSWKLVHDEPENLAFLVCATPNLIKHITAQFDNDDDQTLSLQQTAMLYTSMVLNPEAALLKFALNQHLPVPGYVGSCGRVIVVEHPGNPLSDYLNGPWNLRAELALQLLEITTDFINDNPDWTFIYGGVHLENFAVTENLDVLLNNLEDFAIVDKKFFKTDEYGLLKSEKPCNKECMGVFTRDFIDIGSGGHSMACSMAGSTGGQIMYSLLCQNILSDLDDHKRARAKEEDNPRDTNPGLLNNPPVEVKEELKEALMMCVEEMEAGGRLEAVQGLQELLQKYTQ